LKFLKQSERSSVELQLDLLILNEISMEWGTAGIMGRDSRKTGVDTLSNNDNVARCHLSFYSILNYIVNGNCTKSLIGSKNAIKKTKLGKKSFPVFKGYRIVHNYTDQFFEPALFDISVSTCQRSKETRTGTIHKIP
jgi:hypothetical protein